MENSELPKNIYGFTRDNEPNGRYVAIEVWEKEHPGKGKQKLITISPEAFDIDETKLDNMIEYWKGVARGAEFENPMFTIQGDIGKGSQIAYAYKDGRKQPPLNANSYTIKPILEEGVVLVGLPGEGKSLVYHSPLNSPTLREEVNNFNKLLVRFFKGEAIEPTDKRPGWEFRNEVVVDNTTLRAAQKVRMIDPSTLKVEFGGKHPPKDEKFISLFKQVLKGEIPYFWGLVKKETVKPFSDYKPNIPEGLKQQYLTQIQNNQFPSIHIYKDGSSYIMSDDYHLYYLYLELEWPEIPARMMGDPIVEVTRHLTKLKPPKP